MFSAEQNKELAAPLSKANVRSRQQGGRGVSYIEGWKAIEEANRIFGFDGWTRETIETKCVAEREREIGQQKRPGWGVSYIAKVKVVAFAADSIVTREGVGAGHGIDVDLGQAHESAIKEAETDAMKRALMTFGNPFGLALYDKEQANVAAVETHEDRPVATIIGEPQATKTADGLIQNIDGCISGDELNKYVASDAFKSPYSTLPQKHRERVFNAGKTRRAKIETPVRMAG
jgi:DNA recombination protein Rad52